MCKIEVRHVIANEAAEPRVEAAEAADHRAVREWQILVFVSEMNNTLRAL